MLDKEEFFRKYKVQDEFEESDLSWGTLEKIYDDFKPRREKLKAYCKDVESYILDGIDVPIHSIRHRIKEPEHLIEKIIRKRGKEQTKKYKDINESNYLQVVRDLVGIRILVLSKEEWEGVFDWIINKFPQNYTEPIFMAEDPVAYTRYGDRDIYKNKIHKEHTNKGYRSQHYIVKYKDYYCEFQVRTLAQEVYGEFDHKVKYPYRNNNNFLRRYTNSMSQLLDSVDEIISTCFQMGESGWEDCSQYYGEDEFIDWQKTSQKASKKRDNIEGLKESTEGKINIASYANKILLRKD